MAKKRNLAAVAPVESVAAEPRPAGSKRMRVRAKKMGFYGKGVSVRRLRPGAIFDILESEFSASWMEPIGKAPLTPPKAAAVATELEPVDPPGEPTDAAVDDEGVI